MVQSKRDWVKKAVKKVLEKFVHGVDDTTVDQAVDEAVDEYMEAVVPTIAVTDLKPDQVDEIFQLSDKYAYDWSLAGQVLHPVPDLLQPVLDKFDMLTNEATKNEGHCRSRLDLVIMLSFAEEKEVIMKEMKEIQKQVEKGHMKEGSTDSYKSMKSMRLQHESAIKGDVTKIVDDEPRQPSGKADFALWYGGKTDQHCRLVIIEAKRAETIGGGAHQCKAYMAMVLQSQKKKGINIGFVYGIVTDGISFDFFRMKHDEGKEKGKFVVTQHRMIWGPIERQKQKIVTQLRRIFRETSLMRTSGDGDAMDTET